MPALKCPECDSLINSYQLKYDNCWVCGKDISTLKPSTENDKTNKETMDEVEEKVKSMEISNTYPALKTISGFFNFIAIFSIICAVIVFFYGATMGGDSWDYRGLITMIGSIIYGLIAYLLSKAIAEGILLFIDIANDLNDLKTNLLKND